MGEAGEGVGVSRDGGQGRDEEGRAWESQERAWERPKMEGKGGMSVRVAVEGVGASKDGRDGRAGRGHVVGRA